MAAAEIDADLAALHEQPGATARHRSGTLYVTGDPDADRLLNTSPLALLIGMLLDQQVPLSWAFQGPATLRDRLGHLDAARIAAMDPEDLVAVFVRKPALHRYPAAMARRTHELCAYLVEHHGGDAGRVWRGVPTGAQLAARVRALPGFGEEKTMILVAVLAKRWGVAPPGWQEVAGPFADAEPRSVADCSSPEALQQVRAWKQAMRAARRDKQGRPLPAARER